VERLKEYTEIAVEAPWHIEGVTLPENWPHSGRMKFHGYSTRYRPGMELVLRGVDLEIEPAEKVGIVGRTGAGELIATAASLFTLSYRKELLDTGPLPVDRSGGWLY